MLSTAMINELAVSGILNDETELSQTQNELSSGTSINTPADNPVGAVELQQLNNTDSQYQQYITNGQTANTRLALEQSALSSATTTLQSVQDLVVQANSGSNNTGDLKNIAT